MSNPYEHVMARLFVCCRVPVLITVSLNDVNPYSAVKLAVLVQPTRKFHECPMRFQSRTAFRFKDPPSKRRAGGVARAEGFVRGRVYVMMDVRPFLGHASVRVLAPLHLRR
jgi:hypothetical protein